MFDHRLILLVTPRQIGVLDWRPGRMHWLGEFVASESGLAAFRAIIASHARIPVLLVVDTVDEDYRSEILPHVQGQARNELLGRKLKQIFRNARFTGAWRQARETAGRRDDRYLLASLTDADWLTPWLSVLHQERVPLYGITPLAMACQHLLSKLRSQEPHTLLAFRLNNRLRLSYYHNGQLRFSRLIGSDTPNQLPGNTADEIAKTQLYLAGQRILPRESRLHVLLLDPSGQLDSTQAQLNADPAFSTRLIDIASLGAALRIPGAFLATKPEIAPLAAIAGETVQLNLTPPELLQHHVEFRWRSGLHAIAGIVAMLGLVITSAYWLHAQDLLDQTRQLAQQHQQLDNRYQTIARTFPVQTVSPEQLAQTVLLARQLTDRPADTAALLVAVSQAMNAAPDIHLESLEWHDGAPRIEKGATLMLEASLTSFDGNYRAALKRIDDFIRILEAVPSLHEARLHTSPVNADSSNTLSGRTLKAAMMDEAVAHFSVELTFREAKP